MTRKPSDPLLVTAVCDPLAAVTTKPGKLTKADKAQRVKVEQNNSRSRSRASLRVFMADPQRNNDGPQLRTTQRGQFRVRYVTHGNPNDLLGRW